MAEPALQPRMQMSSAHWRRIFTPGKRQPIPASLSLGDPIHYQADISQAVAWGWAPQGNYEKNYSNMFDGLRRMQNDTSWFYNGIFPLRLDGWKQFLLEPPARDLHLGAHSASYRDGRDKVPEALAELSNIEIIGPISSTAQSNLVAAQGRGAYLRSGLHLGTFFEITKYRGSLSLRPSGEEIKLPHDRLNFRFSARPAAGVLFREGAQEPRQIFQPPCQ